MGSLSNRTAVVTGGAQGIGRAICERLSQEGARVVILDLLDEAGSDAALQITTAGQEAHFFRVDIRSRPDVETVVGRAIDRFGPIQVLVNNAAVIRETNLETSDDNAFDAIFGVNVRGTLTVTRAVAGSMIEHGVEGSIINMSSIVAEQGAANLLLYSASKGAISAMTRSTAVALAEAGIRVNAVAPGSIGTETARAIHRENPDRRARVLSRTPLQRIGDPTEVAAVVAFLAGDDSSYMTGQILYPDGGRTA